MAPSWYVLRSKPNKEEFFWGQLMAHLIEVYYPCVRAKVASPHAHKDKPFLPGHLFIHVDLQENPPAFLEGMPGSRGLVMDDAQPVVVPEALITAIRQQVDQINASGGEEANDQPAEQTIATQKFPFSGYESFFDSCLSANERVHRLHCLLRGESLPADLPGLERNI